MSKKMNYKKLRNDLMDHCGAGVFNSFSMMMVNLSDVEVATDEQLVDLAMDLGISVGKYAME